MGRTGHAPPCMGMLAASWNLHTKVGWCSPVREVIVKHSADKYLPVLLAALYKCATFTTFIHVSLTNYNKNVHTGHDIQCI